MQTDKIRVERKSLGDLILSMEKGTLRVPKFQREFVWERSRVQALLDSMLKSYPIGTLFFWEAPSEFNHMIREADELRQPPLIDGKQYTLILDGQQRLTSLYVVVHGLTIEDEDFSKIVYDLAAPEDRKYAFIYREPDNSRFISIKDLLSYDIFQQYDSLPNNDFKRNFVTARELLSKYPFSIVTVSEVDLEDAIEIFERINQQGRRLSRYDLIAASVLTDSFDLRERTERDLNHKLTSLGFGSLSETNIPQSLALNLRGNTEYKTQLSLTAGEVEGAWSKTVACLLRAMDFLKANLSVLRIDMLPYDAIAAVLQHYFYKANSNEVLSTAHQRELEKWFWRVTFSERYSGASQTRMSEDARWINELIDKQQPFNYQNIIDESSLLNISMKNTTSSVRNGFLCLLARRKPLHFDNSGIINLTGDHFSKFTSPEKHHIFPHGFLKKIGVSKSVHSLPNFCFIPSDLNKKIEDRAPSDYFAQIKDRLDHDSFSRVMSSHFIPADEDSGIWTDDYELFLKQRARLIMDEILSLCGLQFTIREENQNPVIDRVELHLRDAIDKTLSNAYGADYWNSKNIPTDIIQRVEQRIEKHINQTPGKNRQVYDSGRKKLDFIDVGDYAKIILAASNWPHFSQVFRSGRNDIERNIIDFNDYRNAVKHSRQISPIVQLRGNAAILWLASILNIDLSEFDITI